MKLTIALLLASCAGAEQLAVYVTGNNETANDTRKYLARGRGCVVLVQKKADAQAILEIEEASGVRRQGYFGDHQASGQLLNAATGDILWSANSKNGLLGVKMLRAICAKKGR